MYESKVKIYILLCLKAYMKFTLNIFRMFQGRPRIIDAHKTSKGIPNNSIIRLIH